jgi:hypothetical protein
MGKTPSQPLHPLELPREGLQILSLLRQQTDKQRRRRVTILLSCEALIYHSYTGIPFVLLPHKIGIVL